MMIYCFTCLKKYNQETKEDTVWLTKEQIAILFDRDRSVISRHINNIYNEEELE